MNKENFKKYPQVINILMWLRWSKLPQPLCFTSKPTRKNEEENRWKWIEQLTFQWS